MAKIGVQISSVKKYLQTPEDVLESFRKVSAIGYRYIQIQWISSDVPAEFIRDALAETGMICVGTQDYTHEVLPRLDEVLRENDMWGGRYVCVSGIPERQMTSEGCAEFAKELSEVSRRLTDAGKVLVFHPRAQEFAPVGGRSAMEILLDNTPNEFQIELDVYHAKKAGLDPADWLYKAKGRMDLVHFKDMTPGENGETVLTPVGQGTLDWERIFGACADTGVEYCFAEQESWSKNPFLCLEESFRFISPRLFDK